MHSIAQQNASRSHYRLCFVCFLDQYYLVIPQISELSNLWSLLTQDVSAMCCTLRSRPQTKSDIGVLLSQPLWPCSPSIFFTEFTMIDQGVCGWLGVYIFLLVAFRLPSCAKDGRMQRLYVGTCVVFNNVALLSGCIEQTILQKQPRLFGVSYGTFWAYKPMICEPVPVLEASFDDKRKTDGTLVSPLFSNFMQIDIYNVYGCVCISVCVSKMLLRWVSNTP